MKLKFVAYWNDDYNIYSFINDIWNIDGEYDNYLTYGDDYTHLVILNKVNSYYKSEFKNTYGIVIEPYWSRSFDKNILDYCKKIITYQPDRFEQNRTIFSPLIGTHRLYNTDRNGEIIPEIGTTLKILNSNFEKTKKLSIIIGHHNDAYNHYSNESIYNKRQDLVKKLLNSDIDFDMFGKGWNIMDVRYKGELLNKIDGLKDYEYSICLENSHVSGEITEKFIDAIFCNTIPIYNGNKSINFFYPNSCEYIEYDANEVDNIRKIINSNKTFNDFELLKAKELYLKEYNPIKILINDIKNG
jgi:hypothetical protein